MTSTKLISRAANDLTSFREWLRHEIAKSSDLGYNGVDLDASIHDMGLSSVHIVRLTGEIETLLKVELDPTFMYDFDSVTELCSTLMNMSSGKKERSAQSDALRVPVRVAATFTAEPIEECLRHLLGALHIDTDIQFSRYNQVFQELLSPMSPFATADRGVSVLVVRVEDWFRYADVQISEVQRTVNEFTDALTAFCQRTAQPVVLALAPHSPTSVRKAGLSEHLDALDTQILACAEHISDLHLLDLRKVDRSFSMTRIWDDARDKLGHIPFTQACYTALGASIARRVAAILMGPAKVIVLDCDNTLWSGITGEDGPAGVKPLVALQAFMVEQQQSGKLLCLASKNNEADVWATFDAQPEMPLRREHIVGHRINWDRKSDNIRSLAEELKLGLDSFVFLDDNPMEIDEVSSALPEVLAILVPAEEREIPSFLQHHWAFDHLAVTDEDRKRTQMYASNREREEAKSDAVSFEAFLESLELVIGTREVGDEDVERASQLTHRTNQFNANKQVVTQAGMAALGREPNRLLTRVDVTDRFGSYGFVGLLGTEVRGDTLVCDHFMMSCRVLGRRVEHTMIEHLAKQATEAGATRVVVKFTKAPRNQVAMTFFESFGDAFVITGEETAELRFAANRVNEVLAGVVHQLQPPPSTKKENTASASLRAQAADGFRDIAIAGIDIDTLQASIDATTRLTRPALATEYVTPRSGWEKKIATIWRDVLRIDRVGIYDSFYELGGDSLRSAEAFARMWDLGVPESISLQTIPDPTVAGLAVAIEDVKAGREPTLLADKFSLADEGQLAEDIRHPGYDVDDFDRPMKSVFLTGGTGYIGAYLIHELLEQTNVVINCLTRAATPEDATDRIRSNLRRYELWKDSYASRISATLGDLTEPRFGLTEEGFTALAKSIDSIVHSAAWVNFVYPYQHLKPTNVDSTDTVLRLAIADLPNPIQVHFVSTLGVIMSTGYGRDNDVLETDPLLHADDLLNGYEQSKYASDKMVWTAMKERGIPANIYRPGMVGGLADGTYHKLDEFMPQMLKGCIQLGAWPLLDTTWEMAPIDFVSKAIVHIARHRKNLNKAFFSLHPESATVSEHIQWHRDFGYEIRGLPWAVWKRELLNLGTERLRKNALFPFVDFIRALSEEQVYFPPTDKSQFLEAISDMDFELPDSVTLMERYTRCFIDRGYYANLPSGPTSARPNEVPRDLADGTGGHRGDQVDEHVRFDANQVDASEAYYVLWTDPETLRSMVIRYVLHNGPIEEAKVAEVWCWFRDQKNPNDDVAIRQRYPLGRAEVLNEDDCTVRIGPSGYSSKRAWGTVEGPEGTVSWDFSLDMSEGVGVERISGLDAYNLIPHFQSNGVRMAISGEVVVNGGAPRVLDGQLASDGHYWNTKHLKSWSWAHCANFEGDEGFLFEGIAPRLNSWGQPSLWATFVYNGEVIRSNLIDAFYYNRELSADLTSWSFLAEHGDLRFRCTLTARPEDQILIVHALPDDEFLYTHITYTGDMTVEMERKEGGAWWVFDRRVAKGTASFEVTRSERNPEVTREFRIVRKR